MLKWLTHGRGIKFHSQSSRSEISASFHGLIPWLTSGYGFDLLRIYHPLRRFKLWFHSRRISNYLNCHLGDRLRSLPFKQTVFDASNKSAFELAIDSIRRGSIVDQGKPPSVSTVEAMIIDHIKFLIFAGHDSVSSSICFAYYLLFRNPEVRQRVRMEHDTVFGTNTSQTGALIAEQSHLLNQLPYTLAVIKETLRLFPVASTPRKGERGFYVTDSDGRQYPTEGFLVWCVHHAIGRNPDLWPLPDSFIPERFLVSEDDPLFPCKGAWRPFEYGPRNCMGQEMALMEMKIVLAMTIRSFEIDVVYDEFDRLKPKDGPRQVNGDRAYQTEIGGSQPIDGLPCRVRLMSRKREPADVVHD